jgi:hypoxanthine phosphoribosyltransferase
VARLAGEISTDHPDGVVLVGVLKGASIFLADLARAIQAVDVEVDFIAISRYAPDSGRVRILQDVTLEVHGRDVVLVETCRHWLTSATRRAPACQDPAASRCIA